MGHAHKTQNAFDAYDPDNWVKRNERLVKRTGILPLNAETPVEVLLNEAVTPSSLHYVRNHGAVPKLDWAKHVIELKAGDNTINISMDQLEKDYEPCTLLVTFACDGIRRKELNEIRRSNGFDWATGAVSTAKWKGALLRDVLQKNFSDLQKYKFVLFEACDDLNNGSYGTSIPIDHALDPSADVLIAYEMNDERIPPDHGYPVRTVLPGCVGGRMVKWLKQIILSEKESQNWHHFHDNRVLPPTITNNAMASGIWKNPDYLLYELNVNSVILFPAHGQKLDVKDITSNFTVTGYAYDGGGRKISRVEVTLDGGESWNECKIAYPEDYEPRHGRKWWVMCKWSIEFPAWKVVSARDMAVRAWNASLNTQPEHHTWNLLGMMNNAWYRVQVRRAQAECVEFVHPVRTSPGEGVKGWLEKAPVAYQENVPNRNYSWEEVAKHKARDDCWIVVNGKVYDVTDFLSQHPAGPGPIMAHAGTDATAVFTDIHSEDAHVLKASYVIGHIGQKVLKAHISERAKHPNLTPDGHAIVLNPHRWIPVTLVKKESITHDTRRFTFGLPSKEDRMWLPWGKHINLAITQETRMVVRPYTPVKPILEEEDDGTFDLVIKIYFPSEDRPGGELTQMLEGLKNGDEVKIKGPEGEIYYTGKGSFDVMGHFIHCKKVNFIVGGTGLTPALAVIRAALLAEKGRHLQISLVYANKTTDDILCGDELDHFLKEFKDNFKLWHVISRLGDSEKKNWPYGSGHIDGKTLQDHCFPPADDTACFVCGPPAMVAQAVMPNLAELGFDEDHVFEF
ncbi:uncharacterized protein SPPG_02976 [Spizellomyces punctatus DAOM BR117]|uniref:Nitrate reductase [NADPH] n=1 Tax=Spizellomyces punctatus (strain DAOM BR117) TaxID=645134 RepID=A0A0L0HN51_SPIPD|nr:uncharacterized protein SPPG_02976 [Spizellomyces punctatus DAOM BR117]KND02517.1 hypothetical protein SPPG_02976 [Spizellomyces punctatus DAOM BR117]|eukprot:XP_016610556.1 hypothetical protein SPPG_02976 [Spizellomyces punctatus DAOM BR117]